MLVHNQIDDLPSYLEVIKDQLKRARKVDLVISYVQQSGVNLLKGQILRILGNGHKIRLICSFDMEITDPVAINSLMDMGVEVKIHQRKRGTLHSKQWLFENTDGEKSCVVGSANLSEAALRHNVELGILVTSERNQESVKQACRVFDFIWEHNDSKSITRKDVASWIQAWNEKEKLKQQLRTFAKRSAKAGKDTGERIFDENVSVLENYVKSWIDIGVDARTSGSEITGRLWRGWYIIPDHGYIDDGLMEHLCEVCVVISRASGNTISISSESDQPFNEILGLTRTRLVQAAHQMNLRSLFVRREKNYLQHFNFAKHPLKDNGKADQSRLKLTKTGADFARAAGLQERKRIYTRSMREYSYNNLHLLRFLYEVLAQVQKLSFTEFSFFVSHAYAFNQMDDIVALVNIYRNLSAGTRRRFETDMKTYFKEKLEPTAKGVRTNYDKHVKHTMSAMGWCQRLRYDAGSKELHLIKRRSPAASLG